MFVKLGSYNQSEETFDLRPLEYPPLEPEIFGVYFKGDEDVVDYYDDRFFYISGIMTNDNVLMGYFESEQLDKLKEHLAAELGRAITND